MNEPKRVEQQAAAETPPDWSDAAIAEVVHAYERAIRERQASSAKRGELYAHGDAMVMFLRMPGTEEAAEAFRSKHPNYFPDHFWKGRLPSDEELYAGTVFLGGPNPQRLALPFWQAYRDVLAAAWSCGFADEYVVRLLNIPTHAEDEEDVFKRQTPPVRMTRTLEFRPLYPFQQDILTLVRSTWRAKMCEWCRLKGKFSPFIADKPGRRFCPARYAIRGETCYAQHRREVKRDLWKEHGEKWRANYEKRKRKAKGKTSRRSKR